MRIDILHVAACPNVERVLARLRAALAASPISASVHTTEVATFEHAEQAGMRGSPTLLFDGRDPFARRGDAASVSCRLYRTETGLDGAPSVDQLRQAIAAAAADRHRTNPEPSIAVTLNKAAAAHAASRATRRLHIVALHTCARHGTPPTRRHLQRLAEQHTPDAERSIAELVERDLVAVDTTGEVRAIYPFSASDTAIYVAWASGASYAMCAIDALGMSAMLGHRVTITSREPDTSSTITIDVDRDVDRWDPPTAVVYAGTSGDRCCPSADRTCQYINFFTTPTAAGAWAARHPEITGDILSQADALALGISEFASLMEHHQPPDAAPFQQ